MWLGKPVIATAYSGNLDFSTLDNAFLVPFEMRLVGPGNAPYPATARWADPILMRGRTNEIGLRERIVARQARKCRPEVHTIQVFTRDRRLRHGNAFGNVAKPRIRPQSV